MAKLTKFFKENWIVIIPFTVFILLLAQYTYSHYSYIEIIRPNPWDSNIVTVWINDISTPQEYDTSFKTDVEKALAYWENGGNGKLIYIPKFQLVDSPEKANVIVQWVRSLPGSVAGVAQYAVDGDRFSSVTITLETSYFDGQGWRQYNNKNMELTAKHEIGHALGLGHTANPWDIMSPSYESREGVSPKYQQPYTIAKVTGAVIILILTLFYVNHRRKMKQLDKLLTEPNNEEKN